MHKPMAIANAIGGPLLIMAIKIPNKDRPTTTHPAMVINPAMPLAVSYRLPTTTIKLSSFCLTANA